MANNQAVPDVIEVGESGSGSLSDTPEGVRSRDVKVKYLVANLDGYDAAEAKLTKLTPILRNGHRRGNISLEPVGGGWYLATVDYRNESLIVREDMRFSGWEWETNEKSEHINQFFTSPGVQQPNPNEFVVAYQETPDGPTEPGTGGIPNLRGAISVQDDQVRGIDRPVALFNWTETWICPAEWVTSVRPQRTVTEVVDGQPKTISLSKSPLEMLASSHVFHTNKYAFRGKPPGCVLLTGIRTGRMNLGSSTATLTFSFSYSPLRENFYVGSIRILKKDGWDYMDIYYESDSDNGDVIKFPKFVYVGRVFDRVDFRDFGIKDPLPRYWLENKSLGHKFDTPFEP